MPLTVNRTVSRPQGRSISYSQASHTCDLALRWHRERVPREGLGIFLVYGSCVHEGIEAFMKGHAQSHEEAVEAAIANLDREIRSPRRQASPMLWDELPELLKEGGISRAKSNYGRLWCRDVAAYWLRLQVPLWLRTYAQAIKIRRSEHQIFIPLRPEPHWTTAWSFESKLDLECEDDAPDLIVDVKTTADPWTADDLRKYSVQAHLYMGGYYVHYEREPRFKFHVLPRIWDADRQAPAETITEYEVTFDPEYTQRLIDGMIRPKVNVIEAGAFAATPFGWVCSEKFCAWWKHCGFGSGTHL